MAIEETLEVVVARPPAEVFAHLTAVEHWPEWLIASGIVAVTRPAGAGPLAVGSPIRIDQRLAGVRSTSIAAQVTAIDPPVRFALGGRDGDGISVEIDARLLSDGAGSRLRWRLKIGLPLKYRMFERMAAPQVKRAAALDLEAFRRRLGAVAEP